MKPAHNNAFTLVEILIVIGIIGIIAAITIPNLIQRYNEKVTVNKVKRTYSMLTQAFKLAISENGDIDGWDYNPKESEANVRTFFQFIKPYLKLSKDCDSDRTGQCYVAAPVYNLGGGAYMSGYNLSHYYRFILFDGSQLWFRLNKNEKCTASNIETPNVCAVFWYDVNGSSKPNAFGKDVFVFNVLTNRIIPAQTDDCNRHSTGFGCTKYVIEKGNMNYLRK